MGIMGSMLHIGNLSLSTTNEDLADEFGKYGIVESVTVTRDRHTGSSKRIASVVMANDTDAQAAINWFTSHSSMTGQYLLLASGRHKRFSETTLAPAGGHSEHAAL
jgi:hypothetical protein